MVQTQKPQVGQTAVSPCMWLGGINTEQVGHAQYIRLTVENSTDFSSKCLMKLLEKKPSAAANGITVYSNEVEIVTPRVSQRRKDV